MKWKTGTDGEEEKRVGALMGERALHLRERLGLFFSFSSPLYKTQIKALEVVVMLEGV